MSLLLAIETATRETSVALLRGEELVAEAEGAPDGATAETLLPAIDGLLRDAGLDTDAVEAFALSIGPGSFTGLRVGLATVKGLAFGTERPVVAVSTLMALAQAAPRRDLPVVPLLDARRGEVYAAVYDLEPALPPAALPEGVYTPAELAEKLPMPCLLVGETDAPVGAALREELGEGAQVAPCGARARWVGLLGARLLARGEGAPAASVVPYYVRRAEAEVKRTRERFEPAPKPR